MKRITAILFLVLLSGCVSNPEMAAVAASALASSGSPGMTSAGIVGLSTLAQSGSKTAGKTAMSQHQPPQCKDLTFEQAQELLQAGYTYLDPERDGVACMALNGKTTTTTTTEPTATTVAPVIVADPVPDPDLTKAARHIARSSSKTTSRKTSSGTSSGSNCTWVDGYTRKNGTKVRGHQRCS